MKEAKKVFLAAVGAGAPPPALEESLDELSRLAVSAGFSPVMRMRQSLKAFDPAFLIGKGKLKEIEASFERQGRPDFIIFDHPLTPAQTRNLEAALKVFVLDRNQLILEIFARRAKSAEGKLQVQLARLLDETPRMRGAWLGSLSRQGGGGGSGGRGGGASASGGARRGPGEKALETDRRRAKAAMKGIRKKLQKVRRERRQKRRSRQKRRIPSFALAGYTNSGKSSLLNRLSKAPPGRLLEVKDQLFMTLDPKTRKLFLPQGAEAVATDTVGFIRRLPHTMIEAFKATLEESSEADVLLHVIDGSSPRRDIEIEVVEKLFEELKWDTKPVIYVFNKADLPSFKAAARPSGRLQALVSAQTGFGIERLRRLMQKSLEGLKSPALMFFPEGSEALRDKFLRETRMGGSAQALKPGSFLKAFLTAGQRKIWRDYIAADGS